MRGHDYGPHRPEDAPTHVDLAKGKAVREVSPVDMMNGDYALLAPGLLRQRKQLNNLAYDRRRQCGPDAATTPTT